MATVLLEARPYRPFKSSEEYLYAMREDLAEWLNTMYPELRINVDNFMDRLDTGVALCKHANNVRSAAEEYLARRQARNKSMTKSMTSGLAGPILAMGNVHYLPAAKSGTFFARDNVSNFIAWCRKSLQIFECLLFETDDLIMRKNEKHVILCLLEVARRGAKFGMLAPMLVQMERQIDREIAADNKAMGMSSVGCGTQTENGVNSISVGTDGNEMFDSDSEDDDDENTGPMLMYGPQPQIITNDLKSLDEMVRDLVEKCTCPSQFPMVRVSEGKYRIGDTKVLIFVRILRSHVMVRVGGGWDTLSHYLDKHDPCRCRAQHRSSVAARLITRTNAATNGIELHRAQVFYERSPPVARKQAAANPGQQHTAPSNGFISTLSPPGGNNHNRSRSPTPQKKNLVDNSQSPEKFVVSAETRRSMSPGARRLSDVRRKQTSLDSCQSPVGAASPIAELDDEKSDTKSGSVESTVGGNSGADSSVKFENISDNGSEISDEGYRSLGLIQGTNGVSKRTSLHSQVSNEDAELSGRFDQGSNDSQLSPSEEPSTKTAESSESVTVPDELDARTPVSTPEGRNSFEKSGIFITEDEITVDIASATGLRKTGFSDNLYDDGQKKSTVSRIPRSPMATRRKSTEPNAEIVTGLPLVSRKTPVYRSVRKTAPVKDTPVEKNTWSGRDSKKRSSLTTETFTPPSRSASSTSPFHRNSVGTRATISGAGQYDKNGRRMKSTSLTTSPVKSAITSPLAQQILQAAGTAKSDSQILEKMRELLTKYERENSAGEYESLDLTTAWVNSNGALDRAGSGPPKSSATSKKSTGSTISSVESNMGAASPTPRRDRGISRIPAPVRQNTDLY